jgi:large subunit ribosomal protein L28
MTTTALKNMRKYGGFDNYILLTKPKDLDSVYGEYLRRLMIEKINNPSLVIPHLAKQRS